VPDDFYGTILSPTDSSLPTLRGDFDAADAACFTGGTFPADGAAVTTWINKGAGGSGVNLTTGGSGVFYRASSDGNRAIELTTSSSRSLTASSFFHTGFTWSGGYTMFAVLRVNTTNSAHIVANSGNNNFRILIDANTARTVFWGDQRIQLRTDNGWYVIGLCRTIPAPEPADRAFLNGDLIPLNGSVSRIGTPASNDSLTVGSGFTGSGSSHLNRLLIYQGSMTHVQMLRVGWSLMQAVGVPRWGRTLVTFGNSTTEMVGGSAGGCWPNAMNGIHYRPADTQCEIYNLSKSGGTSVTLGTQATLRDEVESLLRDDGRRGVATLFHGHNDGLWSIAVSNDYQNYLAAWRTNGHRSIASPVTPYTGQLEANWIASREWLQTNGLTFHDGVVYHHTETWADAMADPGANAGGAWVDNVHLSNTGRTLLAGVFQAEVLRQFRAITARLCTVSSPASGQVALTRPGHDDAKLPVSLYLTAVGDPAPNGSETPTLTLNVGETTKAATVGTGTYAAYGWSGTGPVMSLGTVATGGRRATTFRAYPVLWGAR
jgi:hypothetical protein